MATKQDLSFKSLLMSISDQLTSEDLERMKFGLDLPQGKLEDVQKPFELFRRMMNAKLLSPENRGHLADLLQFAGRIDLGNELLQGSQFKSTEGEFTLTTTSSFESSILLSSSVGHKTTEWYLMDCLRYFVF